MTIPIENQRPTFNHTTSSLPQERLDELKHAAIALEASFLDEMLKHAGLGEVRDTFSGGSGETQFSSFLRQEQAQSLANAGGIGLAESLFKALVRREESNQ